MTASALARSFLDAFVAKDRDTVLAAFADDGLMVDPHYPQPVMQGKEAIAAGLDAMLGFIQQPGLVVRKAWEDETSCVLETETHHVFVDGNEAHFPQVFVFEFSGDQIRRLQAYVPYPPPAPPA
jgi:ketosteroid isomerase-like protein